MRHLSDIKEAKLTSDTLVSIGVFDGVHIGHQTLIKRLVHSARAAGRKAVLITFFPHPDKVLRDAPERYYLTPPAKRAELLLGLGVDIVITQTFDQDLRLMPAADFVRAAGQYAAHERALGGRGFRLRFPARRQYQLLAGSGQATRL